MIDVCITSMMRRPRETAGEMSFIGLEVTRLSNIRRFIVFMMTIAHLGLATEC